MCIPGRLFFRHQQSFVAIVFIIFLSIAGCRKSHVPTSLDEASGLVWIEGGTFEMGKDGVADASPTITQKIDGFWMQKYEVTNAQFETFAKAKNYTTLAEKNGGSYVFLPTAKADSLSIPGAPWWKYITDAYWKNPQGNKNITRENKFQPVTHIAYEDACAYCDWLEMSLPTEAEWEFAAKGDGEKTEQNIWQGNFPYENNNHDGFEKTAPVGSFPAGKNGLYDINGNVWEWCADYYHASWYIMATQLPVSLRANGPDRAYDPSLPYSETRVIRGGSFLCSDNYCTGYLPFTRMRSSVEYTFEHIGFRCVKRN